MEVGIVGAGDMGHALAVRLIALGHSVRMATSHGGPRLDAVVSALGPAASSGTVEEVAAGDGSTGRLVILAIPYGHYATLDPTPFAGATVVDVGNYDIGRDGHDPRLDSGGLTSGQVLAAHLGRAAVVKAFNTVWYRRILDESRPHVAHGDRLAVPVAADDPAARARISGIVDQMGFAPVDGGTLAQSARQEYGTPVFNQPVGPARATELLQAHELDTQGGR
ncbi:NAD(P)-binding domain-containing protein [Kribbella sancticallisti]|uniref:NAD(P)-binding domain-containing protein n=1 Tax=Kribbella sancticallisti TaxID=460087 RepID=A0ABN2DT26_9ACTN